MTYIVDDGKGGRDEATIQLSVTSEYRSPVAVDDVLTITGSEALTSNVPDSDGLIDHNSQDLVPDISLDDRGSILSRSGKSLFIRGEALWDVNWNGAVNSQSSSAIVEDISPRIHQLADNDGLLLQDDAVATVNIDEDTNDDGWINNQELLEQVNVSFTLPESAVAGDQLKMTDGITDQIFEIDTDALLSGTIVTTFPAPVDGLSLIHI